MKEIKINGCYLARIRSLKRNSSFADDYSHISDDDLTFLYITDNNIIEIRTNSERTNAELLNHIQKDCTHTIFHNKAHDSAEHRL